MEGPYRKAGAVEKERTPLHMNEWVERNWQGVLLVGVGTVVFPLVLMLFVGVAHLIKDLVGTAQPTQKAPAAVCEPTATPKASAEP